MGNIRKETMRCKRETSCNLCLTDCKRAELIAKENEIRDDLLAACKETLEYLTIGYEPDKAVCILQRVIFKAGG